MRKSTNIKDPAFAEFYGVLTAGALVLVGVVAAIGFFFDGDGFGEEQLEP